MELRLTWLGGMRILDRAARRAVRRLLESRPSLGCLATSRRGCVGAPPLARAAVSTLDSGHPRDMARDTNFYYSFLVLTPARRQAIVAVCDFCRAVDDAVDEARVETEADRAAPTPGWTSGAARSRAASRRRGPSTPQTPQGRALCRSSASSTCRAARRRISSTASPWTSATAGIKNFAELCQYCYRVASAVGIVCVQIFGCQDAQSRDYATDLGLALQLTNILRDVKKDLALGRLYLPLDEMARFGVTEDMLVRDTASPNVRRCCVRKGPGRATTTAAPPAPSRRTSRDA